MQAINNPLLALLDGRKQFVIPAFQRDYSWTSEQCEQMWNDIKRAGNGDMGGHFMGSIVYVAGSTGAVFNSWLVIDGQQRLTTLTLLLTALRDHIRETDWEGPEPTPEQIDRYCLKNDLERGDRSYKLILRRHDDETLRSLVDGKDSVDVTNRSDLVVEAYENFRQLLRSSEGDVEMIYRGIGRLNIVDVNLDPRVDNPQLVFESLNSTGVDLTETDLIRNYLLMGLPEPEQTRMYESYWSRLEALFREAGSSPDSFLRDYLAVQQKTTTQARADRIYVEFKEYWQPSDVEALERLLADMVRLARYYVSFLKPERINSNSIRAEMGQVRRLGSAHAIIVTRLYESYEEKTLTHDEFVKSLKLIGSYLVRRSVIGMQTRGYWSTFARMAHAIRGDHPFESFQVALARQSYRFPSDREFASAIQERELYGLRVCWHVLSQLENAGQAEPSPTGEYSIEHVMPQSISEVPKWKQMLGDDWEEVHQNWLHRLGNLTLTAYNSTYKNRPFDEKKTIKGGFEQSAVRLNDFVKRQSRWTEDEMRERGRILAERALRIWPHHNADEELVIADRVRELIANSNRRDVDDLTMNGWIRRLLYTLRDSIRELSETIEVVERRSLCFHDGSANFFAETLPMAYHLRILIPIDFEELDDPEGLARDVTAWKFLPNVTHRDCGVFIDIRERGQIPAVVAMIRQTFNLGSE